MLYYTTALHVYIYIYIYVCIYIYIYVYKHIIIYRERYICYMRGLGARGPRVVVG